MMRPTLPLLATLGRTALRVIRPNAWRLDARRRAFLAGAALAVGAAALPASPSAAADVARWQRDNWVGTWATAPAGPPLPAELLQFSNQTLRLIVHTSIGGKQVRVRLSNELGSQPVTVGAAHVALRQAGAAIAPDTGRPLTFSGQASITIPPGAPVLSDPVPLDVPARSDLAVSLYLPNATPATTVHGLAFQTSYVTPAGNFTGAANPPVERTITSWPFLSAVDVEASDRAAAIVTLGDSITDGVVTTVDANRRWPDFLAARLQARRDLDELGVLNKGISGNRLLRDGSADFPLFGRAGLARFDRDVLAQAGVEHLVVLLGINDIGQPGFATVPASEAVGVNDLIAGYRQLIARAHEKGIRIIGATLTPFEGTIFPGYYSPEKEAIRQAVNAWIRTSGEFDGVIDFDAAVRDPNRPTRMLPAYDSGDRLHPNDAGMNAMANAIDLRLFERRGADNLIDALRLYRRIRD